LVLDGVSDGLSHREAGIGEEPDLASTAVLANPSNAVEAAVGKIDLVAIRRGHQGLVDPQKGSRFCSACYRGWPCLTARLVDAILAAQRHTCPVDVPASAERAEAGEIEEALAEARAQLDTTRAREAATRAVLESIAKAPCLTDLLGDETSGGCDCPACIAQVAITAPIDPAVARIARLEAVANAAEEVTQRGTRSGDAMVRLRTALAALV
jgi:hypothetical protein